MRILCLGCSYTQGYPDYIINCLVTKEAHHGKGLWFLKERLKNTDRYDKIILQLPTPIRFSVEFGDTEDSIREFKRLRMKDKDLIAAYIDTINEIYDTNAKVSFLYYSTGGYPLRHPYDFGEDAERMVLKMLEKVRAIKVIFKSNEYCKSYNDEHPNEKADKICAQIVREAIL